MIISVRYHHSQYKNTHMLVMTYRNFAITAFDDQVEIKSFYWIGNCVLRTA